MNILDINNLPTLTLKVTGRTGIVKEAWIINQEEKSRLIVAAGDISYSQGDQLVITLTDTDFISSIAEDTTLSVILMGNQKPLYRDIVKFKGESIISNYYTQYEETDAYDQEYFIYGTNPTAQSLLGNSDFSLLGDDLITGLSANNADSSISTSNGVTTVSGTASPSGVTFDGFSSLSGNKMYKISFTASSASDGALIIGKGGDLLMYDTNVGSTKTQFDVYTYALDSESLVIAVNLNADLSPITISDYSIREVLEWSISGSEINSFIYLSGSEVIGDTSDYRSTINLSTLTSSSSLESGAEYILTGSASDTGNSFSFKQGVDLIGEVTSSGSFEFTFTSNSTDPISIEFGNALATLAFGELELVKSSM
jgi:hypothetical protein